MNLTRFVAVFGLLFGSFFSTTVWAQENLVVNGSFEQFNVNTMAPEGWQTTTFDRSSIDYRIDNEFAKDGSYSMKVTGRPSAAAPRGARGSVNQFIDVEPGEVYRLSAWYRAAQEVKPETVRIRLIFRDKSDEFVYVRDDFSFEVMYPSALHHRFEGRHLVHIFSVEDKGEEWTEIKAVFRAPEDAARVHLELFLFQDNNTIWWDDVELYRVD